MTVLAATTWRDNGALIADVWRLHVEPRFANPLVLDPTYGRGLWWTQISPDQERFVACDITTGIDFRHLPHPDATFDVVAFDPPYVCVGGRATTTIEDFHDRYGLTGAPRTPAGLQAMIHDGLDEVARVTVPRGLALVKCADYITSGRLWLGTHFTLAHALDNGWTCLDRLEHVGHARAQPPGRGQKHARQNRSTLFVLQRRLDGR